jgi:hypothetical protein
MKKALIAILLFSTIASGQQRSLVPDKAIPPTLTGSVTLTLAEYNRLVELAARKPKPPETAPLPFVLSHAKFQLRLENESVVGKLDMDGEVLQKGPAKIPLVAGLTVLDGRQPQGYLPLLQEGSSVTTVANGPGPFSVSLDVASALTVEAGRASFAIPVPAAASAVVTLDMPGSHANLRLEPGLIMSRTTSGAHTIVEATLEPGKTAKMWWTTREIEAPVAQREVRFLSDVKTLLSIGDSELRIAALCEVNVIQGEPAEFKIPLPSGFEVTEATGSSLESSEVQSGALVLKVREPARRTHQFLIAIERPNQEAKLEAPFMSLAGAQGETGEFLVEGIGTMELNAKPDGGLRRIDVREASAISRSLSRYLLQAAFRYHRHPGDAPALKLEWSQFPDSSVISAIAESATITTLANIEGKALTEVILRVRNHAQPFMKVELPQGASVLSAEVEGQKVKPVQGSDGTRVPLLREGFRPSGAYTVSFVYLGAGSPFGKNGSYEMKAVKLDLPVNLLTWEVFLPDRLEVKQLGGSALPATLFPGRALDSLVSSRDDYDEGDVAAWIQKDIDLSRLEPGQVGGIVVDANGAVISGATVNVINSETGESQVVKSDAEGHWLVSGMRAGPTRVNIASPGFRSSQQELDLKSSAPASVGTTLQAGAVTETVTVTAAGNQGLAREARKLEEQASRAKEVQANAPSQNVANLKQRVAGILPVHVDVPREGKSYRFVRPLVLGEETNITFQYKSK